MRRIQSRLARGEREPGFRVFLAALLGRHPADAVVLACTERPLALSQADVAMPVASPTEC